MRLVRWPAFALLAFAASATAGTPRRIVSTAPSVTETLFALGVGDRVVGVTTFCRHPEAARRLPKIGGYTTPSLEAILALRPDLVIVDRSADLRRRLAALGSETLEVEAEDVRSIEASIRAIARRAGVPERGEALVSDIERRLAALARAASAAPRQRALLLLGHSDDGAASFFAVGPRSFLGEMLAAAGAANVLADAAPPFPRISVEEAIARDPDVILILASPPADAHEVLARARRFWSAYRSARAVRHGAVRVLVDESLVQPGPRIGEKAERLARALRGEQP